MRYQFTVRQQGFSLIELTVAAAIYSMGLGSLSLMMLLAVQGTAGARFDTLAAVHAESLAEMIAMSSDAVGHLVYEPAADPCDSPSACAAVDMARHNLAAWRGRVAADLPGGAGVLCLDGTPHDGDGTDSACDGAGSPVVKVFWQTPATQAGEPPSPHRQVTSLPLP